MRQASWGRNHVEIWRTEWNGMGWVKKLIVAVAVMGVFVLMLNMLGNRPAYASYSRVSTLDESQEKLSTSIHDDISKVNTSGMNPELEREIETKLWGKPGAALEACWKDHLPTRNKTWGYVVLTASNGPHNHRAQIADAVVVASQLGATLLVPFIKEALKEPNSRFDDIYNVKTFIASLEGIVRVIGRLPSDKEKVKKPITSIPLQVTREYIDEKLSPIFKEQDGMIFLGSFLAPIKGSKVDPALASLRCLVMHDALQYVSFIQKLGGRLVNRMREAAPESTGKRFVAVDLHLDLLRHKVCNVTDRNRKRCLEPEEVGQFLTSLGYSKETAVYLTQSRRTPSLEAFQETFPNSHTKEYSMPFKEETQYMYSGTTQIEQALDFYVCSRSDVFVPTVPGVFNLHVTGERIASGLNQVILPAVTSQPGSTEVQYTGSLSPHLLKKSHPVHLCYCEAPSVLTVLDESGEAMNFPPLESIEVSPEGQETLRKEVERKS